jgi:hypothetical protein
VIIRIWKFQEAETKLSIQKKAECESSQSIIVHRQLVELMIADTTIENLTGVYDSLIEFMQHLPFYGLDEIEFQRDQSLTREMKW